MNQHLLKQQVQTQQIYNPFKSPPSLTQANEHYLATKVGNDNDQQKTQRVCPCCDNLIQKIQLNLTCEDQQLMFLGIGYSMFYKLARYFALIIFFIFIFSGSGFYFLVTLNCTKQCIYFFGIPIINLQISPQQSLNLTNNVHIVTAFSIFASVMFVKYKINKQTLILQKKIVSPQQYTIIVQNLPQNINKQQLNQWSKQQFGYKPVSINFAYDVSQLSNAYSNRQKLTIKFNKLLLQNQFQINYQNTKKQRKNYNNNELDLLKQQIIKLDQIIQSYKKQKSTCNKIGTVFMTFQQQKQIQQILYKHQYSISNLIIKNVFKSFLKTKPLYFRGGNVIINSAPNPRQIIWQNLKHSFIRSFIAQILFFLAMTSLVYCAFQLQFKIVDLAYQLRHQSTQKKQTFLIFQALAVSIMVVIVNSILRLIIKLFTYLKRYYSYSSYHSAFCFYYSLLYILNTSFMIYIVHGKRQFDKNNDSHQSVLVYDIHLLMLANALSQPLFKILDPQMWYRIIRKNWLNKIPINQNPYTQSFVNRAFQGYQIQIADNYQYIFRILIVTTWFAHSAPFGVVISLIGLSLDYWIGKYLLLRCYKRPQFISKSISKPILLSLQLLPLVYICGVLQFVYKVSQTQNLFSFVYQFLNYGITIGVIIICLIGYMIFYKTAQQTINPIRYQQIETMFPYNYQTQNPITKFKGEINYLYGVLKNVTNSNDQQIINQLLKFGDQNNFAQRKSMIMKIKRKNIKKLQTMDISQQYYQNSKQMKNIKKKKHSTSSDTSNQKQSQ